MLVATLLLLSAIIVICSHGAPPEQPYTAQEYHDELGFGFSVSWFYKPLAYIIPYPKIREYTHETMKITVKDLAKKGIKHLRLRCNVTRHGFPDNGDGPAPKVIDRAGMTAFLDELEFVVDQMLGAGLFPVISWYDEPATKRGSHQDKMNFVQWWTEVATRLKHKSFKLSFNLFTEMERLMDKNDPEVNHNIFVNLTGQNDWTRTAIQSIRKTGGKNAKRVIILVTPQNTYEESLYEVAEDIYKRGPIMQEYHVCASGPTKVRLNKNRCPWTGEGEAWQKEKLIARLDRVAKFGKERNVPIYFGAWLVHDLRYNTTNSFEWTHFAKFFAETMKSYKFPSTVNQIKFYYDTRENTWVKTNKMDKILESILDQLG